MFILKCILLSPVCTKILSALPWGRDTFIALYDLEQVVFLLVVEWFIDFCIEVLSMLSLYNDFKQLHAVVTSASEIFCLPRSFKDRVLTLFVGV